MKQQQGITLTSFLMVLAVVGFFLFIGMKLFPMYQEYWSVKKAFENVAKDPEVSTDPGSIRSSLGKRFEVGYIDFEHINPRNVKIERAPDGGVNIGIDYEVRKPLIYNLDVVGKFSVQAHKRSGGE